MSTPRSKRVAASQQPIRISSRSSWLSVKSLLLCAALLGLLTAVCQVLESVKVS